MAFWKSRDGHSETINYIVTGPTARHKLRASPFAIIATMIVFIKIIQFENKTQLDEIPSESH